MYFFGIHIAEVASSWTCRSPHADTSISIGAARAGFAGAVLALGSCLAYADNDSSSLPGAAPADNRSADSTARVDAVGTRAPRPMSNAATASTTPALRGWRPQVDDSLAFHADGAGAGGLDGGLRSGGKVGVEFKPAQTTWKIAHGGADVRIDDTSRLSLHARAGGLGVTLRTSFK